MDRSAGCTLCQNWFYRDIALATRILKFQCFIWYVPLFILVFGLFYAKVLCPCVFWAFSESSLMQMFYCVFVFMHARHTLLSLCGGGTKHQQCFLFGSEGRNALVSSDQSMLSKCDDVIMYATEPLNIQMRQVLWYLRKAENFCFTALFKAFR